ncbi:MAG: metal-dependent transcriptional regulator [Elusimicrobiota bacterium]|jgi:DtxR family Mn-dependent transcriptional regulator|nr:metal-dependent transcriptional regulator [Elusimicrobiota bacterium]
MGNSVEIQFRENGSISPVLEDYVKTIAFLKKEKRYARISDIAKSLEVKSPTANVAINSLCAIGLVIHDKYGYVDLTDKGEEIAKEVQNKHDVLFRFLREILSVSPATALKEACGLNIMSVLKR